MIIFLAWKFIFVSNFLVTSRSCSKAPAVNPDCSNHLVNIMRATVCICDQPLCNGLNAVANFSTLNSRIFSNTNINMVTNNQQNNNNKENFMPLHDFNEQRIAAMLGTNTGFNSKLSTWLSTIFPFALMFLANHWNKKGRHFVCSIRLCVRDYYNSLT